MVNKYAIAFAAYIERNILISLLGASTTVFVPKIYGLSILYKSGKTLTQTIYEFTYTEIQLFTHIRVAVLIRNISH
ncbi:hypothetical protein D3C78_1315920 [compost metagenome]